MIPNSMTQVKPLHSQRTSKARRQREDRERTNTHQKQNLKESKFIVFLTLAARAGLYGTAKMGFGGKTMS
jgi:hypothetical protein